MASLQAFIDDSFKDDVLVLAGHVASPSAWVVFNREWEELLPLAPLNDEGLPRFRMANLRLDSDGFWKLRSFYNVLEQHVDLSISCSIKKSDFERARNRFPGHNFGRLNNLFVFTFVQMMDMLHAHYSKVQQLTPNATKLEFIFDEQSEQNIINRGWDTYMRTKSPEIRKRFSSLPRFERDERFVALQAADLWAWWVRNWFSKSANYPEFIRTLQAADFGPFKGKKPGRQIMHITISDWSATEQSKRMAVGRIGTTKTF